MVLPLVGAGSLPLLHPAVQPRATYTIRTYSTQGLLTFKQVLYMSAERITPDLSGGFMLRSQNVAVITRSMMACTTVYTHIHDRRDTPLRGVPSAGETLRPECVTRERTWAISAVPVLGL
jgi:hypothetical protein